MLIKNTDSRYGIITILLHWVMAAIIILMLCIGLYMVRLPISAEKLRLYGWHKEIGMTILMLVVLRTAWRASNQVPLLPTTLPNWQKLAAHSVHCALYFFMFMMPITGWWLTSAAGFPISFFGLFVIPTLIPPNPDEQHLFAEIHQWLAYGLIATICAHVGAAVKHHVIDKDNILKRMLWS